MGSMLAHGDSRLWHLGFSAISTAEWIITPSAYLTHKWTSTPIFARACANAMDQEQIPS
jgi:hypothetical protein